jgi:hypothetical protein
VNIAVFESREQADGFQELLRDLESIESAVVRGRDGFAVDVLRPADFRAGLIYALYYVRGLSLDDLPGLPAGDREEILRAHLVQYALGERAWNPPDLSWYAARAGLDAAALERAARDAEHEFRSRRRGWLARLFARE